MPKKFTYIIEELLTEVESEADKRAYFQAIIEHLIQLKQADKLIVALSDLIQRLIVDHLHVVGDIFDRGPHPDLIMERSMTLPSVDIQWGNHDIVWLAAISGSAISICNLLRISARYGNLVLIEEKYGINLRGLIDYSKKYYSPLPAFQPKLEEQDLTQAEKDILNQVQQATAILQFKLEEQLVGRRPEFKMEKRKMLSCICNEKKTILLNGEEYSLTDFHAPTVYWKEPSQLTTEEEQLIQQLTNSFQNSEKLRRQIDFLVEHGSMYLCYNNNLLFHGCIPLHENGDLQSLRIHGKNYSGKHLLDFFELQIRNSYRHPHIHNDLATDFLWYIWTGDCSSLFGKQPMTTFERYYIADKNTHVEKRNPYYALRDQPAICEEILAVFGLPSTGHIINGHTPVQEKKGESPIKANGKMIVIDGGYAKGYQKRTGVAVYTLVSNSYGMQLAAHEPFISIQDAIQNGHKKIAVKRLVDQVDKRIRVKETTIGKSLLQEIEDLTQLYSEYDAL